MSADVVLLIIGVILIVVGLTSKPVKAFDVEIPAVTSKNARVALLGLGVVLTLAALWLIISPTLPGAEAEETPVAKTDEPPAPEPAPTPTPAAPSPAIPPAEPPGDSATPPATPAPTNPEPTTAGRQIGLNQTVSGSLIFNEGHDWVFSDGPATIDIILDAGPFGDGLLIVTDAAGNQREYVDIQEGSEERLLNYRIPDDSDYTLTVLNAKNEPTEYTLTVEQAAQPQPIGLGQTVTGQLFYNEGNDWLFSDGPATIDVILDVGPSGDALLLVTDAAGNQRQYVDVQAGSREQLLNFEIPDDNDYIITVRNTKNEPADYSLTLEAVTD